MAKLAPLGPFRAFDSNGDPLNGGKLYTYEAGTTTPKATYTDADGGTSNANPVVLDANGYANVWLGDGAYKFVLKTSADVTIWTVDDITGESSNAFGANVDTLTTSTNITDVYQNSFLNCTNALTLSLLPAATAGEGFYFTVKGNGAAVVIDPDGSELIDGASTYTVPNGSSVIVISNGTAWFTAFNPKYIDTVQASDSAGVAVKNSGGTTVATFGAGGSTGTSLAGGLNVTGLVTLTAAENHAKGADIASATTTDIGAATGNFVHITGTTTITGLGTIQAGTVRICRFAGVLTLTHNATSLILPSGANITTAANDIAVFVSEGSGNWRCVSYTKADGRAISAVVVDKSYASSATYSSLTTVTPYDDTIPQVTEGTQVLSATITPKSTANKLRISGLINLGSSGSGVYSVVHIHANGGANAIFATSESMDNTSRIFPIPFCFEYSPASVSLQTITVRVGVQSAITMYLNGDSTARRFGGVMVSSLLIEEITS